MSLLDILRPVLVPEPMGARAVRFGVSEPVSDEKERARKRAVWHKNKKKYLERRKAKGWK